MDRELVLTYYTPRWLGRHLECHGELSSTNDAAMALLARSGRDAHGAVVFADMQTAGRGRFGRTWHTPRGLALAASVALWPGGTRREDLSLLPLASSLSVQEALEKTAGLSCRFKWPNDVLCRGRKISGSMAEARWLGEEPAGVVLGVGINLNQTERDWPEDIKNSATSVLEETGKAARPEVVAAALLEAMQRILDEALSRPRTLAELVHHFWDHRPGEELEVQDGRRTLRGRYICVDDSGALILDTEEGRLSVRYGDAKKLRRIA